MSKISFTKDMLNIFDIKIPFSNYKIVNNILFFYDKDYEKIGKGFVAVGLSNVPSVFYLAKKKIIPIFFNDVVNYLFLLYSKKIISKRTFVSIGDQAYGMVDVFWNDFGILVLRQKLSTEEKIEVFEKTLLKDFLKFFVGFLKKDLFAKGEINYNTKVQKNENTISVKIRYNDIDYLLSFNFENEDFKIMFFPFSKRKMVEKTKGFKKLFLYFRDREMIDFEAGFLFDICNLIDKAFKRDFNSILMLETFVLLKNFF